MVKAGIDETMGYRESNPGGCRETSRFWEVRVNDVTGVVGFRQGGLGCRTEDAALFFDHVVGAVGQREGVANGEKTWTERVKCLLFGYQVNWWFVRT